MRAILDANILLPALLSSLGAPAKILEAWERKLFTLVACEELASELRDVAGRPFFRANSSRKIAARIFQFADPPNRPFCRGPFTGRASIELVYRGPCDIS